MDVKSVFFNGLISEEVYVEQPPGFKNNGIPNHVFKLIKALYGLKQAPRVWYERLSSFLIENNFTKGKVDTILFIKNFENNFLIFILKICYLKNIPIKYIILILPLLRTLYCTCVHKDFKILDKQYSIDLTFYEIIFNKKRRL